MSEKAYTPNPYDLQWEISSASLGPGKITEIGELLGLQTIEHLVQRAEMFANEIATKAGIEQVGISLLPAWAINVNRLHEAIGESKSSIHLGSLDIPYMLDGHEFGSTLLQQLQKRSFSGVINTLGFTALNTPTLDLWEQQVQESLQLTEWPIPLTVRLSSDAFTENGLGDRVMHLVRMLGPNRVGDVRVAVEIAATEATSQVLNNQATNNPITDYMALMNKLHGQYGDTICYSFDTGHMATIAHGVDVNTQTSLAEVNVAELLETVITQGGPTLTCMVELGQVDNNANTHVPLTEGVLDLERAMRVYGKHVRAGNTTTHPRAIIETNPRDRSAMLTTNNDLLVATLKDLNNAFYRSL
ncbi:MAG: hypothetical protein R3B92_00505 [Patescibacteria group bacterium]|uniref:Xylose isomerase-like TIM barrel domain-containing protein n=1 Tax=candidate division WWE3 bacterium TaxID=2053526 RepID=A0A955J3K8_UNCKA|nr:hypothetical protein [candidate division WWE3 bacterium]